MPGRNLSDPSIEAYLAAVEARLCGPRRHRRAIVEELRDGLHVAAAAHHDRGLPDEAATSAALVEFGDPRTVAAAFAAELATAHARRMSLAYLLSGPLVGISWLLTLAPSGWWRNGPAALWASIPALPFVVLAAGAGLIVLGATGHLSRWVRIGPRRLLDLTIALGLACMAGDLLILATLTSTWSPLIAVAVAASLIRLACSTVVVAHSRRIRSTLAA